MIKTILKAMLFVFMCFVIMATYVFVAYSAYQQGYYIGSGDMVDTFHRVCYKEEQIEFNGDKQLYLCSKLYKI